MAQDLDLLTRRKLNSICFKFEEDWRPDSRPDFLRFLAQVDSELTETLLLQLLEIDIDMRLKADQTFSHADYESIHPRAKSIVESLLESVSEDHSRVSTRQQEGDAETASIHFRRVDNYELLEKLGGGAMGDVYLARHHKFHGRKYAIKLLKSELISDQAIRRFEKEINVAGLFENSNIVFAFDAGTTNNVPYLVMEYVQGYDLQQLVQKYAPLTVENACELIRQAAEGLDYAFRKARLTHRDIKPSNLMLTPDHVVKVLDLGLARLQDQSQSMELTGDHQILGTPDYMAPEQWREANSAETTADVYSLACTLFTLLSGHPPFYSEKRTSLTNLMTAHLNDSPPSIRKTRGDAPEELSMLIAQCLSKDPKQRLQSPGELAQALTSFSLGADFSDYDLISLDSDPQGLPSINSGLARNVETSSRACKEPRFSEARMSLPPNSRVWWRANRTMLSLSLCLLLVGAGVVWHFTPTLSKSLNPAPAPHLDRRVAEWVLNGGGDVVVSVDGKDYEISGKTQSVNLPLDAKGRIQLREIVYKGKLDGSFISQLIQLNHVEKFSLDSQDLNDDVLKRISASMDLVELRLTSSSPTSLTERGFEGVERLANLRVLHIISRGVTDRALESIAELPELRELVLSDTSLKGYGLESLGPTKLRIVHVQFSRETVVAGLSKDQLPASLKSLHLLRGTLDAKGLSELAHLEGLRELTISDTPLDSAAVDAIGKIKTLVNLKLRNTSLEDSYLDSLSNLPRLDRIMLSENKITDAAIPALSKLTSLSAMAILGTNISAAGKKRLEADLKHCQVSPISASE